jgi:hypothetical protein
MSDGHARGPRVNLKVRKEPFGLSLSKPFDKLRANGYLEPTVGKSRPGPQGAARLNKTG